MVNVKKLVLIGLVIALAACSSSGTKVDQSQMSQFHKGTTTYNDVIAALGQPNNTSVDGNGNKTIMYLYSSHQSNAQNFIPVANLFASGAKTEHSNAMFTFDQNNILTKMTQSQGGANINTGIGQ